MNAIQTIITERVDDIPLLLHQMQQMGLPTLIDQPFPVHGNWQGLSLGWVCTIWLSSIVSRGAHRLVHVAPWVASRLLTFRSATGQSGERRDVTDDRLERVLRHVRDDRRWRQFENAFNQPTLRVYDLACQRGHVDSTTASVHRLVSEGGVFQFGPSKDHRPDLPQVQVMQAVLDPLGLPVATDVVSGERADDPLYVPCIARVPESLGRRGLLCVGDCTMAARELSGFLWARAKEVPIAGSAPDGSCWRVSLRTGQLGRFPGAAEEAPPRCGGTLGSVKRLGEGHASQERGRHPTAARKGGTNPWRAAGSPVAYYGLRLCRCTEIKKL